MKKWTLQKDNQGRGREYQEEIKVTYSFGQGVKLNLLKWLSFLSILYEIEVNEV